MSGRRRNRNEFYSPTTIESNETEQNASRYIKKQTSKAGTLIDAAEGQTRAARASQKCGDFNFPFLSNNNDLPNLN
jgi:hypothetical protein